MMFFDLPPAPVQETGIVVLAQAGELRKIELPLYVAVANKATQPKISDNCWVVLNEKPAPAINSFNPVSFKIAKALGFYSPQLVAPVGFYQVTVLTPPKKGRVLPVGGDSVQSSAPQWVYESDTEGYVGLDQATFLIKAKGREFTSDVTFQAVNVLPNGQEDIDALYRKLCSTNTTKKMSQNHFPDRLNGAVIEP